MGIEASERYCIADLLVDTATRQVMRDGREIPLPALSFDLLLALLRRAPAVVSTDELMELVWPGRVVNVETVAKRVELLRQALGDDSREPRYIALVRARGYRLIPAPQPRIPAQSKPASVEPGRPAERLRVRRPVSLALWASVGVVAGAALLATVLLRDHSIDVSTDGDQMPAGRAASIAVLPFDNLSEDPTNAYFSDGISEELLTALSKLPQLRVTSRTSSFAFRDKNLPLSEIARALKVDHVVEGSVRKAGDRIRITAQLIDAKSDSHLWAQTYDRQTEDILAIQKEISDHIVTALQVTLAPEQAAAAKAPAGVTDSLEAYQLYLRGRQFWQLRGESNIRQGIRLLTRAIELDPDYARAHAALAQAYATTTYWYKAPDPQAPVLAERAAARAIELDPTLSEPHAARGLAAAYHMDWQRAEAAYRRAIHINANDATAWYWLGELYAVTGRTRDALAILLKTLQLDPISQPLLLDIGALYLRTGNFDLGCPYIQRAANVGVSPYASLALASCHAQRGDLREAEDAAMTAERLAGLQQPVLALVREAKQDPLRRPAALAAIRKASQSNFHLPMQCWELGDLDCAFDVIDLPLRRHNFNSLRDLWFEDTADLRRHARFFEMAERAGLVDYWRQSGWPDLCRPADESFVCD